MRVVLDSNVLISALIPPGAAPHAIYRAWRDKRFLRVTSRAQIAELRRASRYPKLRAIVPARDFGALLNLTILLTGLGLAPAGVDEALRAGHS